MTEPSHRIVETNGIRMHLAEQGTGPLVLMCHGFPESWYSWRHQLRVLAEAGFHAVAPDMRGYGQTDQPGAIDQYTLLHLVGDMVGLLDALGEEQAVIAGHDWGAPVAWHAALLRPDRFRAVVGLSVPYRPRGTLRPTSIMPQTDDAVFYQLYFQQPGVAEAELEQDVRSSLRGMLYAISGDGATSGDGAISGHGPLRESGLPSEAGMVPRAGGIRTQMAHSMTQTPLPAWLTEADLDFYAGEFMRTGFRGGLNWYRNIDRNWELLAPFADAKVTVPALYIAGDRDLVLAFRGMNELLQNLPRFVPHLRRTIMLPGCGHWTQQERASEVNEALVAFLREL
jgi:pimeloyl-ACP methyl ester carboxylesterase